MFCFVRLFKYKRKVRFGIQEGVCVSSSSHARILNRPLSSFVAFFPNRMLELWRPVRQGFITNSLLLLHFYMSAHPHAPPGAAFPGQIVQGKPLQLAFILGQGTAMDTFPIPGAARFLSSKFGRVGTQGLLTTYSARGWVPSCPVQG